MSDITNQWVKMNPFEAAARLNELERENIALRNAIEKCRIEFEGQSACWENYDEPSTSDYFKQWANHCRDALTAKKEAQP